MALWYTARRKKNHTLGKFQHVARRGVENLPSRPCEGWTIHLTRRVAGTTIKRNIYSVSVIDTMGNQVVYLPNFSSSTQATSAAREWISQKQTLMASKNLSQAFGLVELFLQSIRRTSMNGIFVLQKELFDGYEETIRLQG